RSDGGPGFDSRHLHAWAPPVRGERGRGAFRFSVWGCNPQTPPGGASLRPPDPPFCLLVRHGRVCRRPRCVVGGLLCGLRGAVPRVLSCRASCATCCGPWLGAPCPWRARAGGVSVFCLGVQPPDPARRGLAPPL